MGNKGIPQHRGFGSNTRNAKANRFLTPMATKHWAGEADFLASLRDLQSGGATSISSSKIRAVVAVANKYVGDFKMIVYEVEKCIKKADDFMKIAGLFVLDSLVKQHSKEREIFSKRFALRLKDTIASLGKLSDKDKNTVKRMVEEWSRKDIFPAQLIQTLGIIDDDAVTLSANSKVSETNDPKSPSEKRNSNLKSKAGDNGTLDIKKSARICPLIRDGSCPYGDKCRFSHLNESTLLSQFSSRYISSRRIQRIISRVTPDCPIAVLDTSVQRHLVSADDKAEVVTSLSKRKFDELIY